MRYYRKYLFATLCCIVAYGCQRYDGPRSIRESVLAVPDSIATSEQSRLKQTLKDIVFSKGAVENDKLILSVGRDYFIDRNISATYYDLIIQEFKETSRFINKLKKNGQYPTEQTDLEKLFNSAKEEYWEMRGTISLPR